MAVEVGEPLEINLLFPMVKDLGEGQPQSSRPGPGGLYSGI